ncbi:hypothetical protein E2C01_027116 [Portunus trituberculatus]|uniref:Uncharacterized protein n=1 Tax=Portunus trituberculatus TaxID=210409 RepID=A0A5B7EK09_PORTR|nr:hypothetical protein [Portunus trituberculatus]
MKHGHRSRAKVVILCYGKTNLQQPVHHRPHCCCGGGGGGGASTWVREPLAGPLAGYSLRPLKGGAARWAAVYGRCMGGAWNLGTPRASSRAFVRRLEAVLEEM